MILDVDPKLDVIFKHLFGTRVNVGFLIDLLTAVVQPGRPIEALDFVLSQSERLHPDDKETFGDVKVRDQGGRQFQVEMEWTARWFLRKRLLFYWGQFHPQQLREGEHYVTLRPTYTICLLNDVLYPDKAGYHHVFHVREKETGECLCDDLEMHLIELPKFTKTPEQLTTQLDRWLYFLRHGATLDLARLPPGLDVPIIRRAMEVLTVWTQEEREREIVAQRKKAKLDHDSLIADLKDEADRRVADLQDQIDRKFADLQAQADRKFADLQALADQRVADVQAQADRRVKEVGEKERLLGQVALSLEILKQSTPSPPELAAMSNHDLADLVNRLRARLLVNGH